jgi:alpha/beta superfamily hydrolase
MSELHAVRFANRRGVHLVGMVHEPDAAIRRDVAIVLMPPGVKGRVAPHRLYVKMAEAFTALGFWVFRFDAHGLGDSEGTHPEPVLADLYGSIAVGRFIDDTHDGLDFLKATYGVRQFVLGGLCGGAITGVLAARDRQDAVGILGLGLPVMVEGTQVDKYAVMTEGQARNLRRKYLAKLTDPQSWLRLLQGKSDFRLISRTLRAKKAPAAAPASSAAAPAPGQPPAPGDNTNPHFAPAMRALLSRDVPLLLLFSEMDRLWWEFEEKYLQRHRADLDARPGLTEIVVVPEANHVFTLDAWQADMLGRACAWLEARFAPHAA